MAKNNEQDFSQNIGSYHDHEGLSVEKMNFGLWYLEHRQIILNIIVGILIVVGVVSWLYTLGNFSWYYVVGLPSDKKQVADLANSTIISHNYIEDKVAKPMAISSPLLVENTGNVDLAAKISNPNPWHWAEFDYSFIVGGVEYGKTKGFILPSEQKYLISLANELANGADGARLQIDNLTWHRINRHDIRDYSAFQKERFNFQVNNIKFIPASRSGLSEKVGLNKLSFDVSNNSAYSYWSVELAILLTRNGNLVGINHYRMDEVMSGQTRSVDASFAGQIGSADVIEVYPYVNIVDQDVYIEPAVYSGS